MVTTKIKIALRLLILTVFTLAPVGATSPVTAPNWSMKFDGRVKFYQTTELGVLIVGAEKTLYTVDAETGETLWRRKNTVLDETDVAPVPGTDLALLNLEKSGKTRVEAVDLFTGRAVWQSDKIKGSVMHMAIDLEHELLALVLVRDALDRPHEGFKRKPTVYLLNLSNGDQIWKRDLDSDIEMSPGMPGGGDKDDEKTYYTLDNYRAPMFLDGRLYLFYEGVSSFDAASGKESIREKFRVNEEGLALTEADPVIDSNHLYFSGRGKVRAIARATGKTVWEAKDLGLTPEMMESGGVLYVRTGGQFSRLKDGEIDERGPFGLSAIDSTTGKILWRYKGADKGITNLALADPSTAVVADRDEVIAIDAATGKAKLRIKHRIEKPSFVLINEQRQVVVGGKNEIAGFDVRGTDAVWRAHYDPPGRGIARIVAAVAARAAAIYFRYGGVAGAAFRGVQIAQTASSLRWSGIATRTLLPNLSDYAAGAAREAVSSQVRLYGVASHVDLARQTAGRIARARTINPSISIDVDVEDRLLDRLDPSNQLTRLSRFLLRRKQLAALRGQHLYFFTDLKTEGGRGLAGVNLNTGLTERAIRMNEPDYRLTTDETAGLLFTAQNDRIFSYRLTERP